MSAILLGVERRMKKINNEKHGKRKLSKYRSDEEKCPSSGGDAKVRKTGRHWKRARR